LQVGLIILGAVIVTTMVDSVTLMGHIRDLLAEGGKGTLFILTENNHSLTLTFESGQVTGLSSRGLVRGSKALDHLSRIGKASYRVDANVLPLPGGMPNQDDVIRILGLNSGYSGSSHDNDEMVLIDGSDLHSQALLIIEQQMEDALGPYAAILMRELRATFTRRLETFEDAEAIVRQLAKEIDSDSQAEKFLQVTLAKFEKLFRFRI
jgi:hypothetical protein